MQGEEQKSDLDFRDDPLIKKALEVFEAELARETDTVEVSPNTTPTPQFRRTEAGPDPLPSMPDPQAQQIRLPTRVSEMPSSQRRRLGALRSYWDKVGRCTQPANRKAAEESIREAYDAAGLKQPGAMIWTNSPWEARRLILKTGKFGKPVWFYVLDRVRKRVVDQIVRRIGRPLFEDIQIEFNSLLLSNIQRIAIPEQNDMRYSHGCHGASSFGALDFCHRVLGIEEVALMRGHIAAAKAAGWWWPFSEACVITERPIRIEYGGQWESLHCANGPALVFPDGLEFYAWHGMAVPKKVIMHPEKLKIGEILGMPAWWMFRLAIERYGMERFLKDSKSEIIHSDDFGTLYRKKFANGEIEGENEIAVVKVVNATAERDGSFRDYFLYVPPEMKTAREAVAWTFGLKGEDYAPDVES